MAVLKLLGLFDFLKLQKQNDILCKLRGPDGMVNCAFICCDLPYQYVDEYFAKLDSSYFKPIRDQVSHTGRVQAARNLLILISIRSCRRRICTVTTRRGSLVSRTQYITSTRRLASLWCLGSMAQRNFIPTDVPISGSRQIQSYSTSDSYTSRPSSMWRWRSVYLFAPSIRGRQARSTMQQH